MLASHPFGSHAPPAGNLGSAPVRDRPHPVRAALGRAARPLRRGLVALLAAILLLPYLAAPLYRFGHPVSTLMLWRWTTGAPVERTWVPISRISPALVRAVVAGEDARFCSHHGIDWIELRNAMRNAEDGADLRGASTITQQVAKNLFLWQGRSFVRKALELPLALWIDLMLPKQRIMEIYLNIAEWGPHGELGAEAGARHAFARSAHDLTARQAALLAAVLPNPVLRRAGRPTPLVARVAAIYQRRAQRAAGLEGCILPAGH